MDLHVSVDDDTETLTDVEYFEIQGDDVYVEFEDDSTREFVGEVYGGDA